MNLVTKAEENQAKQAKKKEKKHDAFESFNKKRSDLTKIMKEISKEQMREFIISKNTEVEELSQIFYEDLVFLNKNLKLFLEEATEKQKIIENIENVKTENIDLRKKIDKLNKNLEDLGKKYEKEKEEKIKLRVKTKY